MSAGESTAIPVVAAADDASDRNLPLDARLDHIKISLIQPCVAQLQVTQLIAFIWVDSGIIDDEVRSLRCQEAWQRVVEHGEVRPVRGALWDINI